MKWSKKLRDILRNRTGTMSISLIVFLLIAVIVFLFAMDVFNAAIKYQNVTYSAKSITKVIECDGAVTSRAYEQLAALNKKMDMDMTFDISDVTYFDSRQRSIQFRDPFVITVRYKCKIQMASPLFTKPVVWEIPMVASIPGMSEVYWK